MGIIKNALQEQISSNSLQQVSDTTGIILSYSITSNTASIRFDNPNGDGVMYRKNVKVSNTMGAVSGSGITSGQACSISFIGNNIHNPVITGMLGNNYMQKTTSDEGAYILDSSISKIEEVEDITPMVEDWIDTDNENSSKYNTDLKDYTGIDATEQSSNSIQSIDRYTTKDQGITNLDTKSTVKLKENGDIDIFVSGNLGIRISPNDNSVNVYGTFKINNKTLDMDSEE